MGKRVSFFVVLCAALSVCAFESKVEVPSVGEVKLVAPKPGGWTFSLTAAKAADGADVVHVKMAAPADEAPAPFEVKWYVSQRDIHHFWTSESTHYGIPWHQPAESELTNWLPLYSFLDANDANRFTFACSESCRKVVFQSPISESQMGFNCRFRFFTVPEAPLKEYAVSIRFDARDGFYGDRIQAAADWMCAAAGIEPMPAPESAFDPLYSSWYVFHQDVTAKDLEEECARAAALGMKMKTLITDDGWQIDLPPGNRPWGGYRLCGDWKPGVNFPDMKTHVKRVHDLGFRYMLWYSVPFVGEKSANFPRFKGKFLPEENSCAGGWVLDPRFPEVRAFIVETYEKAVREWDIDGLKLDFIGRFTLKGPDPAAKENYAGRDIKAIPVAVDALLTEVMRRLKAIKPDILIEFRQGYIGPSIRRFGNMLRATDCPCSMVENRTRIARTRLTSGTTAVHSDMLEWRADETPESAARCILNSLFGVVQYSVRLKTLPASHIRMMRHWIAFSQEHRGALVKGAFRPRYPAADYPLLEGEDAQERVIGVYQDGLAVPVGAPDRPVCVLNGTFRDSVVLDLPCMPLKVEAFDTFGNAVAAPALKAGVQRVAMPVSGYLKIFWKPTMPAQPFRFMTFNIWGDYFKNPVPEREGGVTATVLRHRPDIVSLQEVTPNWWASRLFTELAKDYGIIRGNEDEALVRAGADLAKRKKNWVNHEPLLYRKDRFTCLESGVDFFHMLLQPEKSVTWAVLEDKVDGRRLIAFATHFWWKSNGRESDSLRELNVRHILGRIADIRTRWGDLPVVGGGDLNCHAEGMPALLTFEQNGYLDAGKVAATRSDIPSEHRNPVRGADGKYHGAPGKKGEKGHTMLDRVFFTGGCFTALRHEVVTDQDALDVSDHSPVVVDLECTR